MSDSGREQEAGKRSAPPHEEGASAAAAFCPNPASQAQADAEAVAVAEVEPGDKVSPEDEDKSEDRMAAVEMAVLGEEALGEKALVEEALVEEVLGETALDVVLEVELPGEEEVLEEEIRGRQPLGGRDRGKQALGEEVLREMLPGEEALEAVVILELEALYPLRRHHNPPPHAQGLAALPEHDSEPATALQQPTQPSRNNGGGAPASQAGPSAMSHAPTTRDAPRRALLPLTQEERIQQERERHERAVGFDSSDDEEFIPLIRDL
ncbi:hypothetical protein F4776DRAFT_662140 [Hypoxylon sp. NC0597]|nr:hypothetical protein F4776DRAFT_662140 [Hypoxylon sp. NC0597]